MGGGFRALTHAADATGNLNPAWVQGAVQEGAATLLRITRKKAFDFVAVSGYIRNPRKTTQTFFCRNLVQQM